MGVCRHPPSVSNRHHLTDHPFPTQHHQLNDISILTNIYFHVLGKIPMCALNLPEQQHKSPNVFPDQFCKFKQKIAKCWHKRLQLCSIQMFNSLTLTLHVFGNLFWQKIDIFYFKLSPTFSKLIKNFSNQTTNSFWHKNNW